MSTLPQPPFKPVPKSVAINGSTYDLIAFYFPGNQTPWDVAYQAPFFGNFWQSSVTFSTPGGSSGTFHTAEAAFQATKWWDAKLPADHGDANALMTTWNHAIRHFPNMKPKSEQDFYGTAVRPLFEECPDGGVAFRLRQRVGGDRHKHWPAIVHADGSYGGFGYNVPAMEAVLAAKFSDPALQAGLMATGDAYLLEHNSVTGRDHFWSDNNDGTGGNHLGKALMRLRATLSGKPEPTYPSVGDFTPHV